MVPACPWCPEDWQVPALPRVSADPGHHTCRRAGASRSSHGCTSVGDQVCESPSHTFIFLVTSFGSYIKVTFVTCNILLSFRFVHK